MFNPQLTKTRARKLAEKPVDQGEKYALSAGSAIRNGSGSRNHLLTIFEWKTNGRGKNRLLENSGAEIKEALSLATAARQPRTAIAVLTGLYGVDTPVASAIATMIYPECYIILDFRALRALGHDKVNKSIPFYLDYL